MQDSEIPRLPNPRQGWEEMDLKERLGCLEHYHQCQAVLHLVREMRLARVEIISALSSIGNSREQDLLLKGQLARVSMIEQWYEREVGRAQSEAEQREDDTPALDEL